MKTSFFGYESRIIYSKKKHEKLGFCLEKRNNDSNSGYVQKTKNLTYCLENGQGLKKTPFIILILRK